MAQQLDPPLPLRVLIPNLMTTLALCVGLSGIRLALVGNWDKALMAIVLAGVLDGLDGWVARRVRGQLAAHEIPAIPVMTARKLRARILAARSRR